MIVRTRAQNVANRVPGQRPNLAFVSLIDGTDFFVNTANVKLMRCQKSDSNRYHISDIPDVPEENGAIRPAAAKELLMEWVPRKARGLFFMAAEGL